MSWLNLNQSLNSLKGQITNFASEVLSEGIAEGPGEGSSGSDASFKRLEEKCRDHELQIAALRKVNEELEATLQAERLTKKNGIKDDESNWYWDPPSQSSNQPKTIEADLEQQYLQQIHALQAEISTLRERNNGDAKTFVDNVEEEINRLREENKNLTTSLEDLDNQHQLAMERLLGLKRDLQTNFELLKQEHETLKNDNDQYSTEIKELLTKIEDKQRVIDSMSNLKSDYDTLHHKYQNLERIHSLLRENAEKFQEENQELHEEVFKLQEQVTKLEHDLEIVINQRDTSNTVPREKHEEVLKELNDLKERQNSNQIHLDEINADDNAKIVIENLKREINELKHKLQAKPDTNETDPKVVKSEKITQLYNKYVNFELPIDYVGEIPSTDNNTVLYKLESVFKTLNSFKKDMDILHQKLSEKNLNINHLQAQIDDLTTENDFLTTDIQHYERELGDMKKNNDFLLAEIAVLKSTSKLEPIIETHEDSLGKLETELADCNRINRTFESELRRIEIELDEVRTEKTVLQESLNDLRNKYTTLLSELEIFKTQSQAVEELECNATVKQAEHLRRTTDEIDDLRKRLNCAFAKNEQLSIDIHIIENDKVLLTNEVAELKLSLVAKSSMCRDLEATNISLQQRLQEFERDFTELSNQKEELKQKLRNIEGRKSSNEDASQVPELNSNTEVADLLDKLDETVKENNYMKETIDGLTNELMALKVHERELISRNSSLKSCRATYLQNASKLHQTIKYLKAKLVSIDTLSNIVNDLENENKTLVEMKVKLEAELSICHATVARLEEEHEVFLTNFYEKCSTIDSLNVANENFSKSVIDLEYKLDAKDQELESLKHSLTEVSNKLAEVTGILETAGKSSANNDDLDKLISEKEELTKIISAMQDEVNAKDIVNKNLNAQIEEIKGNCDTYKSLLDDKEKEIVELNQFIEELTEKIKTNEKMVKDEIAKKEELAKSSQNDIDEIKTKYDQLESSCAEYKTMLEKAASEKNELISLVNSKHNESVQYHNEINRLNHVLVEQAQEFQRKEREMSSQNSSEVNKNCENLSVILKERDETIVELKNRIESYTKANAELNESFQNLTKKYDITEKSLSQQLEAVKKVTAENIQLSERSENLTRELERLRQHLMETEENYTQELMASEQKLTECQTRLHQVEERAKQTSNVYTSNSIRANQEVETLRNQIKLLEKQREDVQSKLSDAEDARSRSEAAVVNLQVVLEQFQSDKERDIDASTEKIKNKMEQMKAQNVELKHEIAQLNLKLNEAQAGLQAATRLGDQVENKTAQINDLKEQVRALQTSVSAAEERYYNAVSNQQDKVDKNLVKNLVINYVMTAANSAHNKSQVLRIMSTVLDFNQQECEKLGLVRNSSAPDSLAAEFVKFLQNESRPRPPLPNMMTLAQNSSRNSTPASRRNSGLGPHPNPYEVGHKRNPSTGSNNLLFQNMEPVEPTPTVSIENEETRVSLETGVNQTRNTEGAILKHVLKDM